MKQNYPTFKYKYFLHIFSFHTPILLGKKNKKKCKINSRNFTYDGLTLSSSLFLLEDMKDEFCVTCEKHNGRSVIFLSGRYNVAKEVIIEK